MSGACAGQTKAGFGAYAVLCLPLVSGPARESRALSGPNVYGRDVRDGMHAVACQVDLGNTPAPGYGAPAQDTQDC